MRIRKLAAVSILTIGALGVAGGTAYADPAADPVVDPTPVATTINDPATFVNFVAAQILDPNANTATVNTPIGSLTVGDGQIEASTTTGDVVGSVPLAPATEIAQNLGQGEILEQAADALVTDPVAATRPVPVTPVLDYGWKTEGEREQWAFSRAQNSISLAAAIATVTGSIGGGLLGCAIFGAGGAAVGSVTLPAIGAVPGAIGGCVLGVPIGVGIGAVAANLLITAPVAIAAGIGYFNTINTPFVPPKSSPQKVQIVE